MLVTETSLGEVVRRLDGIASQMQAIVDRLDRDREANERTYVRRDVYDADQRAGTGSLRALEQDLADMKADRQTEVGFRRQVLLWGAGLTITSVISIVIAVANIVSR